MFTTHWPTPDEIVEGESEDEVGTAQPRQELAAQASIDAAYDRYMQTKPDGKLTFTEFVSVVSMDMMPFDTLLRYMDDRSRDGRQGEARVRIQEDV